MARTGWQRLWIVLSLLLGVPSAFIAWGVYSRSYATVSYSIKELGAPAFWQRAEQEPKLDRCVQSTMRAQYYSYSNDTGISCDNKPPIDQTVLWFLIPGGILWLIGATVAWVVRGFRQPKQA